MQRTLNDIVETLRAGKGHDRPCSLLIGAGCSVTAGIPTATEFVRLIEQRYPSAYKRAAEKTYPACMAALESGLRRDLIVAKIREAKINWAHMAIAQLIKLGYIDRVLTVNFDPLVSRACAMVGEFPAVYDFAASTLFRPAEVAEKAVFHLHGQSTGFVLMNTEDECTAHVERLGPLFDDAGRGRSWIVVGYSGDNDPVFRRLAAVGQFQYGLYWIGYLDAEPSAALNKDLLGEDRQAYFVKGYDADRFFVELAQRLGCFPPGFVDRPFSHLREMLGVLTPFRPPGADTDLDVLDKPRKLLDLAICQHEPPPEREQVIAVTGEAAADAAGGMSEDALELMMSALLMADKYGEVQALASRLRVPAEGSFASLIAWAFLLDGNDSCERAKAETGDAADALFGEAGEKYLEAVRHRPDYHAAFFNWGNALAARGNLKKADDEAFSLFCEAGERYAQAVRLKPDYHEAFNNWGLVLSCWAERENGDTAEALYCKAVEKYSTAARIKPDKYEVFYNWGYTLSYWARSKTENAAELLYSQACEKYAKAVEIAPDRHEAWAMFGNALFALAKMGTGERVNDLLRSAAAKYFEAARLKPEDPKVFQNLGGVLLTLARTATAEAAEALYAQVADNLRRAEALMPGSGSYNLACLAAGRGRLGACRHWLETARAHGTLPDRAHLENDADLEPVRDLPWFRDLLAAP